ncbi:acyltransferase [Candidatus Micrarchaeota archaeon]|nr:acyltransferase [Candidatus Micrarchaeota archaeon]
MFIPPALLLNLVGGALFFYICTRLLEPFWQQTPQPVKERLAFVDFLKGASIAAVVLLHAVNLYPQYMWIQDYLWFAVPLFIFCTGYLLARKYPQEGNEKKYYSGMLLRIVIPYLLYAALNEVAVGFAQNGGLLPAKEIVLNVLLGMYNGGNLYFIPLIMQLYLIYPIARKMQQKMPAWLFVCIAVAFSIGVKWFDDAAQAGGWNSDPVSLVFFGRYFFFFAAGMYLAHMKYDAREATSGRFAAMGALCLLLILAKQALYLGYAYFYPLAILAFAYAAFEVLGKVPLGKNAASLVRVAGENSYAIYIFHAPFIYELRLMGAGWGWGGLAVACTAALIGGIMISKAAGKLVRLLKNAKRQA